MADRNHILLFPHEHTDLLGAMQGLSVHSRTRPKLHDLLTAASTDVNDIATMVLNGPERATIGEFEDLTELAERHVRQQRPSFVAEMVLLTTLQIGQLLMCVGHGSELRPVKFKFELTPTPDLQRKTPRSC